jgi:hypothetical protein
MSGYATNQASECKLAVSRKRTSGPEWLPVAGRFDRSTASSHDLPPQTAAQSTETMVSRLLLCPRKPQLGSIPALNLHEPASAATTGGYVQTA